MEGFHHTCTFLIAVVIVFGYISRSEADCPTPTDDANGGHDGSNYTQTAEITYTCNANYGLATGTPVIATCQGDDMWSITAPTCLRNCTADPSAPSNGAVSSSTHLEDNTVTYTCDSTYGLNGSATATCGSDGSWDNIATTCVEDCGQPPALTNGQFTAASTIATSTGTYTCDPGYTLNGTASRTCQTDRTWDGTAPTCQEAAESSANGVYSRFTAVLLSTCLIIFFQTTMTWK